MTSRITVNNIESNSGISSIALDTGVTIAEGSGLNVSGIVTATKFVGPATGLIDSPNITVGNITASGTVTYEDVTNVDAIGIITAREGIKSQGSVGIGTTTTAGRNAGVSTATGTISFNATKNVLQVYNGTEWRTVTTTSDNAFEISYLVIGGGGAGGGSWRAGGGGAGEYRTNYGSDPQGGGQSSGDVLSLMIGTAYSIVIGAGGAGSGDSIGADGANSVFASITSNGGGGGAKYETVGSPGGSGGGGGGHTGTTRAGGASDTYGYDGGSGSNDGNQQTGGGGGGAGGVGYNGSNAGTGGDGGAALAGTITGSSVLRAGGGGAGSYGGGNNLPVGGGGGAGTSACFQSSNCAGTAATANTGSGGGGSSGGQSSAGGAGGSGVVILRYPSSITPTFTGGVTHGTPATVGNDKVVTVTATSNTSQTVTFN